MNDSIMYPTTYIDTRSKSKTYPQVLFITMPFAPYAIIKHTEKLIKSLAPNCQALRVISDNRVDLTGFDAIIVSYIRIPILHHLGSIQPALWSAILWILKLVWIWLKSCITIVATRRETDVVVCFASSYHLPMLACARLCGHRVVLFDANSIASNQIVYGDNVWGRILLHGLHMLRYCNRKLVHILVLESWGELEQADLNGYRHKISIGTVYTDTNFYCETVPLTSRSRVVGFIGRFTPEKGILPFIQAAAMLQHQGIQFHIIGDGPQKASVKALLNTIDASHIKLFDWVHTNEIVAHYNNFCLYVMPSLTEGMPNSAREAMACGTPVLITKVGGVPDLIEDGKTGFILTDRTPEGIANAILDALQNPRLSDIAQNGRNHVMQTFSLASAVKQWQHILMG